MNELAVAARRRKDRKLWRTAMAASLLGHLLVLLLGGSPPIPPSPFAAAGPKAGDDRPAAGGMQALNVLVPPTVPLVPPPIPLPVEIEIAPVELAPEPVLEVAAVMGEQPGLPARRDSPKATAREMAERPPKGCAGCGRPLLGGSFRLFRLQTRGCGASKCRCGSS